MADSTTTADASPAAATPAAPVVTPIKKGTLVKVNRQAYLGSLEAAASDPLPPAYLFEGPGEVLALKGDHALLRWNRPVPDVWLRLDQLAAA